MRKRNEFDEFLRQLEEAIDEIIDEIIDGIENPENRPLNIEISINLCPFMAFNSGTVAQLAGKTPMDILETENNIHAILSIPDMEMETIKLMGSGKVLEITALSGDNAINERIELPERVNKKFKARYKNGILEVVFNKPKKVRKSVK